jgi:hypothetical protein
MRLVDELIAEELSKKLSRADIVVVDLVRPKLKNHEAVLTDLLHQRVREIRAKLEVEVTETPGES